MRVLYEFIDKHRQHHLIDIAKATSNRKDNISSIFIELRPSELLEVALLLIALRSISTFSKETTTEHHDDDDDDSYHVICITYYCNMRLS